VSENLYLYSGIHDYLGERLVTALYSTNKLPS